MGLGHVIAVIADSGSPASIVLHQRTGFADVGRLRRVGLKHGRWLHATILQRPLD